MPNGPLERETQTGKCIHWTARWAVVDLLISERENSIIKYREEEI